jgi:hypothetical protein
VELRIERMISFREEKEEKEDDMNSILRRRG